MPPARPQPVAAQAAGQRRAGAIGNDHAAVTAVEAQHRQQARCQRRTKEVGLEREQIAGGCGRAASPACGAAHEPCAAMSTPARTALVTARSPARNRHCHWPGPPAMCSTLQGCQIAAPLLRACSSISRSSVSRPSARPHWLPGEAAAGSGAALCHAPCSNTTVRSSAPAAARTAAPTPSASSKGRLLAAMHSPQTLRRGNSCISTSAHFRRNPSGCQVQCASGE